MTTATTPQGSNEPTPPSHATAGRAVAIPHLLDWLQNELSMFPRLSHGGHEREMRSEQYVDGDRLVLRIELPAVDPEADVDVAVADSVLTVQAERRERRKEAGHSEFFYGKLLRTFMLPPGADEQGITACYRDGVLELTIPLGHPRTTGRSIAITRAE